MSSIPSSSALLGVVPPNRLYSPSDLLRLANFGLPSSHPHPNSNPNSSSYSDSGSNSNSSRASSNPSPVSSIILQLQNFPDILVPSAADTLSFNHNAATLVNVADGRGEAHSSNDDEDGFVYGETSVVREDLDEEEIEALERAVKLALLGSTRRSRQLYFSRQAQSPRTPSRASSPVRGDIASAHDPKVTPAPTTTVAISTASATSTPPVIVHTGPPNLSLLHRTSSRSRSRAGTVLSNDCMSGIRNAARSRASHASIPDHTVVQSTTIADRAKENSVSGATLEWRRRAPGRTMDRRNNVIGDGVWSKGSEEANVTSWRKMERGLKWRWNEPSGSYIVVKA